jgi:hypothetical protein
MLLLLAIINWNQQSLNSAHAAIHCLVYYHISILHFFLTPRREERKGAI